MGAARRGQSAGGAADLEAKIERSRQELAASIDAIAEKVAPKNVASAAKARARGLIVDSDGEIKKDKAALVGGIALAFVTILVWRRFH
ncbi:MAG: DUF3618 domain-containing protein [Sporichthyaceae bacterium]